MGIYTRPDSPFYWLSLERPGDKSLREPTRIPKKEKNRQLADERYRLRMTELELERRGTRRPLERETRNGHAVGWCYIYFALIGDTVKIGRASNVTKRIGNLQVAHSDDVQLLAVASAPVTMERQLHRHFREFHIKREWFRHEGKLKDVIARVRDGEDLAFALYEDSRQIHS